MVEVVRKLKVNRRYESAARAWCGDALLLGEEGAVCEACESPHHARCWDEGAGCGGRMCVNAPLRAIGVTTGGKEQPESDEKWCPYCGKIIYLEVDICPYCNESVSADGLYHGERHIPYEAKLALGFSIAGFFIFGPILGSLAFIGGRGSAKHIATNPRLRGRRLALAAQWIGAADVVLAMVALALSPTFIVDIVEKLLKR
jgi:hypothetical protein